MHTMKKNKAGLITQNLATWPDMAIAGAGKYNLQRSATKKAEMEKEGVTVYCN